MKSLLLVLLCYFLPSSEPRLVAFVANSTHIVTYNSSPDGHLSYQSSHTNPSNAAWVAVYPTTNPTHLLATATNSDGDSGSIALYSINQGSGQLMFHAQRNTSGSNPAYVSWDTRGNWALVANYGSGDTTSVGANIAVLPVNRSAGTIGSASITNHSGNGTNPDRQTGPHPHMIGTDSTNQFVFSTDLGNDRTYMYLFNSTNGNLTNNSIPYTSPSQDGSGPRHFVLHPDRLRAYVINELTSTIDVYMYDYNKGLFTSLVQSVNTLPDTYTGSNTGAEIAITPDGKFLYASNRGFDSIVGYYIDPTSTDFNLKRIGWATYRLSTPRNFAIDPTGRLLLVGASATNEIVAFNIGFDGVLVPTGAVTSMAGAISIVLCEIN